MPLAALWVSLANAQVASAAAPRATMPQVAEACPDVAPYPTQRVAAGSVWLWGSDSGSSKHDAQNSERWIE